MKPSLLSSALLAAATMHVTAHAAAQVPPIVRGFPSSTSWSEPIELSADGRTVIGRVREFDPQAQNTIELASYVWTAAEGREPFLAPAPWASALAETLSKDGTTVAGELRNAAGTAETLFVWTRGTGVVEVPEVTAQGNEDVRVASISADGSRVVYRGERAGVEQVYLWDAAGGITPLEPDPSVFLRVGDLSDDGEVVTGLYLDSIASPLDFELFRWTAAGGLERYPLPPGAFVASIEGVSDDGSVVVGSIASISTFGCFRWTAATGAIVPPELAGHSDPALRGLDGPGSVMVGDSVAPGSAVRTAFRIVPGQGLEDLGVAPGFETSSALGVDADGDTVVGASYSADGSVSLAFGWTPADGRFAMGGLPSADSSVPRVPSGLEALRRIVSDAGDHVLGWTSEETFDLRRADLSWDLTAERSEQVGTRSQSAVPTSSGVPARLYVQGSTAVPDNDLTLTAVNVPPGGFCLFLDSDAPGNVMNVGGGAGTLLLGGGIGRFIGPGQVVPANSLGLAVLPVDLTAVPRPNGLVAVAPGDTLHFQAWFRDFDPGLTSNLTDAVEVGFH